ncbi:MAG TPA: hypothetical protein VIJ47_13875 [Acidimicrobiales bacterium]
MIRVGGADQPDVDELAQRRARRLPGRLTVAVVGARGHPDQLAISAEPAGGSTGPTSNPVVVGTLS